MNQKELLQEDSIDFKGILNKFFSRWYYFVLTVAFAYGCAKLYLRYQEPIFRVSTSMLIKEEASPYKTLGGADFFKNKKSLYDEMALIKSFDMINKIVSKLDFKVSYYHVGDIRTIEMYKDSPFKVVLDTGSFQLANVPFFITILPGNKYRLEANIINSRIYDVFSNKFEGTSRSFKINEVLTFGKPYKNENISFTIFLQNAAFVSDNSKMYFIVNDLNTVTQAYKYKLSVYPMNKDASIIELSVSGPLLAKEIDFLNMATEVYIQNGLDMKNQMATNTIKFIDEQLGQISTSLKLAENEMESFKSQNKSLHLGDAATNAFKKLEDLEAEKSDLLLKLKYYEYILDYVKSNKDIKNIVAPSAIGIEDPILSKFISELISLKAERATLSGNTADQNPYLMALDNKIKYTTESMFESVKNILKVSNIPIQDLNRQIFALESTVNRLPKTERILLNIERKFNLNDHLYNFLLEKRAESAIAKASNKADNMVVDTAKILGANQVAPRESFIYTVALMLGFLFPILLIIGKSYFNDKIESREDLFAQTKIPILGIIGHNNNQSGLVVFEKPKSSIAEAFRSLRINLNYLAPEKEKKVITITSSVSGEGKTFSSINLASIISISGKKTLLIGADLRKPKIYNDFNMTNSSGLSSYLSGKSTLEEIINVTQIDHLDLILSGPVPPNPAELISIPKMDRLIEELKLRYDYIVIDTPPIGLVSDAFLLMKYSDINIYVVRHKYTEKKWLEKIDNLYSEGKIKDVSIIINDLIDKDASYGYGYRYGYGYYYNSYGYYDDDNLGTWDSVKNMFKGLTSKFKS